MSFNTDTPSNLPYSYGNLFIISIVFDEVSCIYYYVGVEQHQSVDFEREKSAIPTNPQCNLLDDDDDDDDKGKHQILVKSKQRDYFSINPRPIHIQIDETQLGDRAQSIEETILIR